MLEHTPTQQELMALVGEPLFDVWAALCSAIDERYDMDRQWASGGKAWEYEYKYRRGGKTLRALYARENRIGFMVILGKDERAVRGKSGRLFRGNPENLRRGANVPRRKMGDVRTFGHLPH